jgi:conjugative relaxase-like TrwC/TraI family protein
LLDYYAGLATGRSNAGAGRGPVDYYLDPDEPPGRWWGDGREGVGLSGDVAGEQLEHMLQGRHPETGARLGRGFGDRSARGFDATFSAPKSVSLLWALSPDPWVRAEVLAAHDAAVEGALGWFAQHGAHTRRGTDGVHQVDTRGVVAGLFRQHTSRTMDPQLHTHAVIWSKVQDQTGKWLALDARFLKRQQRSIGWIYDAALRSELTARLGVEWDPIEPGAGQADVDGVPESLRAKFSERSDQVSIKLAELLRRWVDDHDGADPDPRTIATLERRAVIASRPTKLHGIEAADLHAAWRDQAADGGLDPDHLPGGQRRLPTTGWDPDGVIAQAIDAVGDQASTWLRADLAREIASRLPPDAADDAPGLVALVDELAIEADTRCERLHPEPANGASLRLDGRPVSEHVTRRRLTTPAILLQEHQLIDWATMAGEPTGPELSVDGQQDAAQAISGQAGLVLVVGPAGSGKTSAVARAVATLREADRPVVGLAPSGKAADVLAQEAACPTSTLAKLLHEHTRLTGPPREWDLPAGTTVIVDEAGMVRTNDLAALVGLARGNHWRLVCVGDPDQLPAVGRGGMFAHWCDTLSPHRLDQIHRFDDDWQAEASLRLRQGDPDAARPYADHGRLRSVHPTLVTEQVARQHQTLSDRGESVAITTSSASMARAINVEIQHRSGTAADRAVGLADGTHARSGDQIATRRNDPELTTSAGGTVRNRQTWTVDRVHRSGDLTVSSPALGTVRLTSAYVARHVELGWAVTGYGNQGATTDHGICVIEPGSSRAGIYVGMTRGRKRNIAWTLDPTGLDAPEDTFASAIARPPNERTAHAVRAELQNEADRSPASERMHDRLEALQRADHAASPPVR